MPAPTLVILGAGRARRYGGVKQLAPIGQHGEGVIDFIAADAVAAGFGRIVIVVNHETGPTIRSHVETFWPATIDVSFAVQETLRGTVDAVLAAEAVVGATTPFAVSNADDIYGLDAFRQLRHHLATSTTSCLVAYQLENSLVGDLPVSRGTCQAREGRLTSIVERRNVHVTPEGLTADDELTPRVLEPDTLVSMNLWGFQPTVWPMLHRALEAHVFTHQPEVLLPTFVAGAMRHDGLVVDVLSTASRCIGVTHAEDLSLAQYLVREEIKHGLRPAHAFAARDGADG